MFTKYRKLLYALPLTIALVFNSISVKAGDSERQRQLQQKHDELLCKIQQTTIYDIDNYARFVNYHNKIGTNFPNQVPISELDNKTDELVLEMFVNDYLEQKQYYKNRKQKKLVDESEKRFGNNWSIGSHKGPVLKAYSTKDLKKSISELCDLEIPEIRYHNVVLVSQDHTLEQLLGMKKETKIYEISALHLRDYLNKISELRNNDTLLPQSDTQISTSVKEFFMSWTGKGNLGEQKNIISVTQYEKGYTLGLQPLPTSKRSKKDHKTMILVSAGDLSKLSLAIKCIKDVDPEPFAQIPTKFERFRNTVYGLLGAKVINWFMRKN